MDEKEVAILGDDPNYWWFRAKDELIRSLLITFNYNIGDRVINIGAGTTNYEFAHNYNGKAQDLKICEKYDFAILADVLEHIPAKDRPKALRGIRNAMVEEGILIVTVPAYQWLFNAHDRFLGHYLRYTRHSLKKELKKAGFEPVEVRYWNSILFVPLVIRKLLNKNGKNSDFKKLPSWLNTLLYMILKLEEYVVYVIPFGISVVGVFRKC
jgi:hypothetical protein